MYVEPWILRPFIDRMIEVGVLPEVKDYSINWPPLSVPTPEELADTSKKNSEAIVAYADSLGADMLIPPEIFLKKIMHFTEEEVKERVEWIDIINKNDTDNSNNLESYSGEEE